MRQQGRLLLTFLSLYYLSDFLLYREEYLPVASSFQIPCIRSINTIYIVSGIPALQLPNRQGSCPPSDTLYTIYQFYQYYLCKFQNSGPTDA